MDIQELETQYKTVHTMPRDIQYVQVKDYLQLKGWLDRESIDILIGKLENESNRQGNRNSIYFGLAYPAILLVISVLIALSDLLSPETLKTISFIAMIVSVIMIMTAKCLETKAHKCDLIDLLYDFKEELV